MKPLAGTRVLDLTSNVSGPFVTMVLSRLGADVVKVERPPGGDDARQFPPMSSGESVIFGWCNTGKRSVALDLRRPEGLAVFRRLAGEADVVVHSFKPGVVERLGVAEADLREWGADALYCDISAFGHGESGRDLKGYDPIVQAFTGIMDMTGYDDGPPARCAPSIIDLGNGMWVVIGILAALMARGRGEAVGSVGSALVDAAVALVPWQATVALETGARPQRRGASHELGAPYDLFATADRPLFLTAANQSLWQRLVVLLGAEHLLDDPRFATPVSRASHATDLKAALEVPLKGRRAEEWLVDLTAAGIPASLVLGLDEAVRSPVAGERDWFEDVDGQPLVRLPFLVDGRPLPATAPAPRLGQHTHEVLGEAGLAPEEVQGLLADRVVLADPRRADPEPSAEVR